jgi:hypothetical protein
VHVHVDVDVDVDGFLGANLDYRHRLHGLNEGAWLEGEASTGFAFELMGNCVQCLL